MALLELRNGRGPVPNKVYRVVGKRALDLALLVIGLPVILPALVVTAVAVRVRLGRPVLYAQLRPGLKGMPFRMYKFRSMTGARDATGELLPDAERLTPFGRRLRATSLDELPELWNVMTGKLSLVGPRPLLMEYLPRYNARQARRHDVKPGLTGWAQVNGRNAVSWDQRFEMDVWYVDNISLALDLKIIAMTLVKVLRREGISQPGEVTMSEFLGSGSGDRTEGS